MKGSARPLLAAMLSLAWTTGGALMAQEPAAPAAGSALPTVLGVEQYAQELRAIDSALAAGALEEAARRAQGLGASRVAFAGESVRPDPALIAAVTAAPRERSGAPARARVQAVLRGLERPAPGAASPDPDLLARVKRAEQTGPLRQGGQVAGLPLRPSVPQRVVDAIAAFWRSVSRTLGRIWDSLKRLWPRRTAIEPVPMPGGMTSGVTVLIVIVAIGLIVLAVLAIRRSVPPAAETSTAEQSSARDEDPLSREMDEWEEYAAQLARAGRIREAIRAWYHAVLVGLFRAGLLHHQKGRTNWEYVARVPPESAWRPAFISLTRRFDREWYGRERSAPEALRDCASEARDILRQVRAA